MVDRKIQNMQKIKDDGQLGIPKLAYFCTFQLNNKKI